ncbi:MAG: 30S ribosomal protein S2 [Crocinitomicaceae bacterium]|nr:30S ribosomal protein S2 [Crocinitomicaceae bacterium]
MSKLNFETLLEAGVHFGHLKRKWNPAMAPYIFEEKKGIHIIDLNKTMVHLDHACAAMKQIAKSGKKVLFVATKKQAKEIVSERVTKINMPFVTERWSGGMLTNFQTTRKSIRKMALIDKMKLDGTWDTLNKREKLFKTRQRDKLEKTFGSIAEMTRQPAAIFIVDILKEHIALAEARRLNIPTFAMVDTNSNPKLVDFPIPSNDDATKSITLIMDQICLALSEGLEDRKNLKEGGNEESTESSNVAAEAVTPEVVAEEIVTEAVAPEVAAEENVAEITEEVAAEEIVAEVTEEVAPEEVAPEVVAEEIIPEVSEEVAPEVVAEEVVVEVTEEVAPEVAPKVAEKKATAKKVTVKKDTKEKPKKK